jgi:hypothetical protein
MLTGLKTCFFNIAHGLDNPLLQQHTGLTTRFFNLITRKPPPSFHNVGVVMATSMDGNRGVIPFPDGENDSLDGKLH